MALGASMLLTVVVFANGLSGDFVLDDQKQIVRNDLIRSPRFWGEALKRDIWAFKGQRDEPWSNYWRPGHVAWLIANFQLFGATDPRPWHVTNLLAHLAVDACAYVTLRCLGATTGIATAIFCIFAVHPTRCESVTWIAGGHDVLAALGQLLALICLMSIWRHDASGRPPGGLASAWRWIAAVLCFTFAISTKEIAIFFPIIIGLVRFTDPSLEACSPGARWKQALLAAVPFAGIAILFLMARSIVLQKTQLEFPWQPKWTTVIASLPMVICFYLRQMLFPYWVGWSYPIRVVHSPNLWNFFIPLSILIAVAFLLRALIRSRIAVIGATIFILTLLPALNLKALHPEQVVKDRYLYMPLLGILMVVVPAAAGGLHLLLGNGAKVVQPAVVSLIVVLLSVRTMHYNRAWITERALWEWAVRSDPSSAFNHQTLGVALMDAKRFDDALLELDRSLGIHPKHHDTLTARAEVLIGLKRFTEAAATSRELIELLPHDPRGYERLAIALERQNLLNEAADLLREGREHVAHRYAVFTDKLAVVLVLQGKREEALAELESVRERAEKDFSPGSRMVFFHLGMLYRELGRSADSAAALRRFLDLTAGSGDPNLRDARRIAAAAIQSR